MSKKIGDFLNKHKDKWYSAQEIADALTISKDTVYGGVHVLKGNGIVKSEKIKGRGTCYSCAESKSPSECKAPRKFKAVAKSKAKVETKPKENMPKDVSQVMNGLTSIVESREALRQYLIKQIEEAQALLATLD